MVNLKLLFLFVLKILQIGFFIWQITNLNLLMRCIVLANVSLFFYAWVDFQLAKQFSLFWFHWSNAVQQNIIRHQFNGLGKDHSSDETLPVFWVWAPFAGSIFILPNTARSWYSVYRHIYIFFILGVNCL